MTVRVDREQDLVSEAIRILLAHMPPDKVARVLADETVASLATKIRQFEQQQPPAH